MLVRHHLSENRLTFCVRESREPQQHHQLLNRCICQSFPRSTPSLPRGWRERASASWLGDRVTLSEGLDKALLCPAGSWRSAAAQAVDLSLTHMGLKPRPSLVQVNAPPPAIVCSLAAPSLLGSTPFLKETQLQHIWFVPGETRHPPPTPSFCTMEATKHENSLLSDFGSFQLLRGTKHMHCLPATLRILPHRSNSPNAKNICENLPGNGVRGKSGLNHSYWRQAHSASSPVICSIWGLPKLPTASLPTRGTIWRLCSSGDEVTAWQPKLPWGREVNHHRGWDAGMENTNY